MINNSERMAKTAECYAEKLGIEEYSIVGSNGDIMIWTETITNGKNNMQIRHTLNLRTFEEREKRIKNIEA